jgi:signal transduction histidine kinase
MAFLKKSLTKSSNRFYDQAHSQGTGLGLSLAYDIVKAHGGEIGVETKEMEGSTFTVQLPRV